MAQAADFSAEELESIRIELKHYEQRIKKLHHLEAELKLVSDGHPCVEGFFKTAKSCFNFSIYLLEFFYLIMIFQVLFLYVCWKS